MGDIKVNGNEKDICEDEVRADAAYHNVIGYLSHDALPWSRGVMRPFEQRIGL
jgi:hypothetical protein